ncbi:MAG: pentapeptide repeat-containing protein, partial [Pseudomonadota bacterium]
SPATATTPSSPAADANAPLDLTGLSLCAADLRYADFSRSVLTKCDLSGARIDNACFSDVVGDERFIRSRDAGRYRLVWTAHRLFVGPQERYDILTAGPQLPTAERIARIAGPDEAEWWALWRPKIAELIRSHPAEPL